MHLVGSLSTSSVLRHVENKPRVWDGSALPIFAVKIKPIPAASTPHRRNLALCHPCNLLRGQVFLLRAPQAGFLCPPHKERKSPPHRPQNSKLPPSRSLTRCHAGSFLSWNQVPRAFIPVTKLALGRGQLKFKRANILTFTVTDLWRF